MSHGLHWHAGARSRLLLFNLLVMSVTLAVSLVAIFGFRHAGHIQEQAQAQTLADMNGSLALARDTANVAIAAVRLSQVVGALEYQSESARLQQTQQELQHSLNLLAHAPLAEQQPQLLARIRDRSQMLEQTINQLLLAGHQRHLQRNVMLSGLWQSQLLLNHINLLTHTPSPSRALRQQTASLLSVAIQSAAPQAAVQQLATVLGQWQTLTLNGVLNDQVQRLITTGNDLLPVAQQLEQSDIAIAYATYRIKALVAMLNDDITHYVQLVAQQSDARSAVTHEELDSIIGFIGLFMLLALLITGYAGYYIYRNLGSSLTAIAHAMTRLAQGEKSVNVPGLARRDELGDLARAFNVFARNTASLAQTSRLLREKSNQLESTEEALLHSQKMKAVGQLTGGLAHDFNNLLAVIIGSLALTVDQLPPGTLASRIDRARQAADRAAQLTQRLLAFSRKQALYPRAVAVVELVENLHSLLQHALLPGQNLVVDAQGPGWPAWIDAGQLENALMNLVVNARDAMEKQRGEIRLRIWNQRKALADGERDCVTIEVIDHGCGMSNEVREQVFEPFFTTKAIGSGSGLGLSMVYGFVRQSGGQIELETAPGQGTTVRLLLPRAPEAVQPTRLPVPIAPTASNDRLILVLDDEPAVRQTLCEHLHQLGYLTLECGDGESALALLRQTPDIDMLISDLMLSGGMNGADVIRQAQAQWPHLATMLISGQDLRRSQVTLPLCERLAKPWHQAQLVQTLERAWQRSQRLNRARRAATTAPLSQ
ncbi:ATP-binding protein [Pantoea sp.]|uniref:ATP-binding protein n=1 Tax=Pantoea sp. TaxID=69393 RepID=UPI0031D22F54